MTVEHVVAQAIAKIDAIAESALHDSALRLIAVGATPEEVEACLHPFRDTRVQ